LMRGMQANFDRSFVLWVSIFFAHLLLLVIVLAFMWMWRIGPYRSLFLQTLIAWHWILGLVALPFLAFHVWRRWPKPKREDFAGRRSLLQITGVGAVGIVGAFLSDWIARSVATEESPRRFTGSRRFGFFTGNDFPITGEPTQQVDVERWRLQVEGAVARPLTFSYEELRTLTASKFSEVIDCTSGWYSIQDWQGIPLRTLFEQAEISQNAAGVRLFSVSGYNHTYPLAEAQRILLATHVTGEILAPRHGYPLRAVVPGRRGWFWVKWLERVEVLDSPLQVIAGMLASPREVLRQF